METMEENILDNFHFLRQAQPINKVSSIDRERKLNCKLKIVFHYSSLAAVSEWIKIIMVVSTQFSLYSYIFLDGVHKNLCIS